MLDGDGGDAEDIDALLGGNGSYVPGGGIGGGMDSGDESPPEL